MRVLYDISTLGLGHLYSQSRGGAFRAELHIVRGLAASGECDLRFCANHSTVAYRGCEGFLRVHADLGAWPLISPRRSGLAAMTRSVAGTAHRRIRRLFGSNVLPSTVRRLATMVDGYLHPPVAGTADGVDIHHASLTAPLPPARGPRPRRFLTLYDLAFLRFPELYGPAYRAKVLAAVRTLQPDDQIITGSGFSRGELLAGGIGTPDRIHVVPLAADGESFYPCTDASRLAGVRRKYGIPPGPYVLGVNTPDPRKNVDRVIQAFARLAADPGAPLRSLVLVGHPGPGGAGNARPINRHRHLDGRIIQTGFVPDEDLAPLYSGAEVFVYCPVYEGFGLPPLEAMACGTPVVTSNTSSLPEVVGDAAVMVSPLDAEALAGAILGIHTDRDRRQALQRRALVQAGRFTWAHTTAATLQAYRAALAV